jgi:hypothetical protein
VSKSQKQASIACCDRVDAIANKRDAVCVGDRTEACLEGNDVAGRFREILWDLIAKGDE